MNVDERSIRESGTIRRTARIRARTAPKPFSVPQPTRARSAAGRVGYHALQRRRKRRFIVGVHGSPAPGTTSLMAGILRPQAFPKPSPSGGQPTLPTRTEG